MPSSFAPTHTSRVRGSGGISIIAAGSLLAVLLLLRLLPPLNLPFPVCAFRELTHLPCPLCGGTRALISLSRGGVLTALGQNPLDSSPGCYGGLTG